MEKNKRIEEKENKINELRELGLEVYETTTETMLEEMGASIGANACCSRVIVSVN